VESMTPVSRSESSALSFIESSKRKFVVINSVICCLIVSFIYSP